MGCCQNSASSAFEVQVVDFIKENIRESTGTAFTENIKKRISDILFPILRKVFVHSVNGSIDDSYDIFEIIGQGSFSTVRRAAHIESRIIRAVKIIAKNSISSSQQLMLVDEIEILKSLDHPNIIQVIEIIEDRSKLNIITEICTGGELFDRIINSQPFTENIAATFMCQILSGLIHVHQKGFVHRDIKPENILFLDESAESPLKIIDFGISKRMSTTSKLSRFIGTVRKI